MRYEVPYILPWVSFNIAAGINHVYIYEDDLSPTFVDTDLLASLRSILQNNTHTTLISMWDVLEGQNTTKVLANLGLQDAMFSHCASLASKSEQPGWMASWDVDEVPIFAAASEAAAEGAATPPASLPELLDEMPETTLAVLVPRYEMMGERAKKDPFADSSSFEYEYYTHRSQKPKFSPKPIYRFQHTLEQFGPHIMRAEPSFSTRKSAALASAAKTSLFSFPDGTPTPVIGSVSEGFQSSASRNVLYGSEHGSDPALTPRIHETADHAFERISAPLKLFHYGSRSTTECMWKVTCNGIIAVKGKYRGSKTQMCEEDARSSETKPDSLAAAYAPQVRKHLPLVFGESAVELQDELTSWFHLQFKQKTMEELLGELRVPVVR